MAGFLISVGKAGDVAERSPAVISANLKEDMLMQKKIVILNRSERSVVHQIMVDQKVLYKRFQSRLVRSKLAFSRIMGQKDMEKELRSKNIGRLNTDIVGHSDEECSFLDKLEHRPCTASSYSPRVAVVSRKQGRAKETNQQHRRGRSKTKNEERASSAKARLEVIPEKGVSGQDGDSRGKYVRPATTLGLRLTTDMLLQNRTKRGTMSPIAETAELVSGATEKIELETNCVEKQTDGGENESSVTSNDTEKNDKHESERSSEDNLDDDKEDSNDKEHTVAFLEQLDFSDARPKSMGNMKCLEESPPISPKQLSRRTSKAADFFQEEKKMDLVALRLKEARSKDYTERVQNFCEEMEEMISGSHRSNVDYYASRLQASVAERLANPVADVPGTPEDENNRAMGNIFIRSLTVPVLNLD